MSKNILVIGGNGKTGRRVAKGLKELNQNVRIGGRSSDPVFDWSDPSTFEMALRGIDRAYVTYYPDLAVPGAKEAIDNLVDAAKDEGLEKVVLLSGKGEREAEACEEIVANSGMNYTIVRASWFNQNFSESFLLEPILAGHVALPMPDAKVPFVDADDIAEVVVKALLDDETNGQTYEITGPRKLSFEEVINTIAEGTGRVIHFQAVSMEEYNGMMRSAGLPEDYIWLFDYLFTEVLGNEANQVVSHDVEKLLGRKATDFTEYVERTAKTGVWNQTIPQAV
ncbi:MAG: NmrA family NAD(P)-binding protein [Eudoraea sp.]|nr:NmrA family NAD(P)-binding protein [Eudoraea sp.]